MTIKVNLKKQAAMDRAVVQTVVTSAVITTPLDDMFWGTRYDRVRDPSAYV